MNPGKQEGGARKQSTYRRVFFSRYLAANDAGKWKLEKLGRCGCIMHRPIEVYDHVYYSESTYTLLVVLFVCSGRKVGPEPGTWDDACLRN